MKQIKTLSLLLFISTFTFGQGVQKIEFNKGYSNIKINKSANLTYKLGLDEGGLYQVSVLQQGIDVVIILSDNANNQILEQDAPNGQNGLEQFEYSPKKTQEYLLTIKRLEQNGNSEEGKITINVKKFSKNEIKLREKIKRELESENNKNVQTIDIDHFWEAFDNLKKCKTHSDSVASFQKLYLDRATNGLKDFIRVRGFSSEKFVAIVSRFPKFYNSIRKNTYEVKKAAPLIDEVFLKFKEIYPNFKPFKVCFAIGLINTGGTVSDNFVLIGTEISTSTGDVDLAEFNNHPLSKVLASKDNIVQKIKNIVSHECVHTQQKIPLDKNAIGCNLLYAVMREGFCDFIGELVAGGLINKIAQEYGDKHEKELWKEFKNEMCKENPNNWLYNQLTVKDKPADLGYYIGYKIAQEYYQNAADKKQAIIDIIEMNNPLKFLEISKYDQKQKN